MDSEVISLGSTKTIKKEPRADHHWQLWCRLCAKEDAENNVSIFDRNSQTSDDLLFDSWMECKSDVLAIAVERYFLINMTRDEELPKVLCTDCISLITALTNFTERVTKVQQMFTALLNKNDHLDTNLIRLKYGVTEEERQEIFLKQAIPQSCYSSITPEVSVFLEDYNQQNKSHMSSVSNPLEDIEESELSLDSISDKFETDEFLFERNGKDDKDDLDVEKFERKAKDDKEDLDMEEFESNTEEKYLSPFQDYQREKGAEMENLDFLPQTLICTFCNIKFKTQKSLKIHKFRKHGVKTADNFKCNICHKYFRNESKLALHRNVHYPKSNEIFICEECGITFKTLSALKEHQIMHSENSPFECDICKKGFKGRNRLKKHMEVHDPNKHICPKCGLALNSKVTLNRHLLVHSDLMRFKCDYCGREFKRAKALKTHLILHTGLKPYSCDFCDRTFANGSNCRSHKKKNHPEELAALEAAGCKAYNKNIPRLEALKAVTKSTCNLMPVVTKKSGHFYSSKKANSSKEELSAKVDNQVNDLFISSEKSSSSLSTSSSNNTPTLSHIMKQQQSSSASAMVTSNLHSLDSNNTAVSSPFLELSDNRKIPLSQISNELDSVSITSTDVQQAQLLQIQKDAQDYLIEPQQLKLFPSL